MARGKHGKEAAIRRAEAAHEHIDRLTDELVEAKRRMKDAIERAERLEGVEKLLSQRNNDELLADALEKIAEWERIAKEDGERRKAAIAEMYFVMFPDLNLLSDRKGEAPMEDRRQFLETRYPALMSAISAGKVAQRDPRKAVRWKHSPFKSRERKLSPDEVRRLQRVTNQRLIPGWDEDKDVADSWIDMLDAAQAGFSSEDFLEFVTGEQAASK